MHKIALLFLILFATNYTSTAQTLEWVKGMGGAWLDAGFAIAVDSSGNVYTTGTFQERVDFDPNADTSYLTAVGNFDIFIQKLDARGNFLWARSMGGSRYDHGSSIVVDDSGNVYTTGIFEKKVDFDPSIDTLYLSATGDQDIFIQKLDADGGLLWARSMGGFYEDRSNGIALDANNNVYNIGWFNGAVDFDPSSGVNYLISEGETDAYIQKLSPAGNFIWAKRIGGTGFDKGSSLEIDGSGNIYALGAFSRTVNFDPNGGVELLHSKGSLDIYIQKLDAAGDFLWVKSMGGTSADEGHAIEIDKRGNIYSTGYFQRNADFDPSIATHNLTAMGRKDIFVQKLDRFGNLLWAKGMGGSWWDEGNAIKVDGSGNVYTIGHFGDTVDFDPNIGVHILSTENQDNIFIQKLNDSGNLVWVKSIGGLGLDVGQALALDASRNIYTTGIFWGKVDFDPSIDTTFLTAIGTHGIFVQKLNQLGNVGIKTPPSFRVKLYPNPNNGLFKIELPSGKGHAEITFMDAMGRVVYKAKLSRSQNELDLSHLTNGIYHIEMILYSGEKLSGQMVLDR